MLRSYASLNSESNAKGILYLFCDLVKSENCNANISSIDIKCYKHWNMSAYDEEILK